MTQMPIIFLTTAGIVLVVDLVTTYLRRRARRTSVSPEPSPAEMELEDLLDETVILDPD